MASQTVEVLQRGISEGLHTGAQIYISHRGKVILDGAIGEMKPGVLMTRDSITLWMSASKPLAAICIAMLWEKNLLSLDDPVIRFIPEFGSHGKLRITIRHLLTHTGGFRGPMNSFSADAMETIIARICAMKPEPGWVPGLKAGYHVATSWFILGEIIRRLTGRGYDQFVRESLFEPLGCMNSFVGMPAKFYGENQHRIAPMYSTNSAAKPLNTTFDSREECAMVSPGANGRGPIRELARVYEFLCPAPSPLAGDGWGEGKAQSSQRHGIEEDLDVRASGHAAIRNPPSPHPNPLPQGERGPEILRRTTIAALTAPHRIGMMDATFRHLIDWGLGFIIDSKHYNQPTLPYGFGPYASARTFGHSGNQSSCAFCDQENQLVVAWACNGQPGEERHLIRQNHINAAVYADAGL